MSTPDRSLICVYYRGRFAVANPSAPRGHPGGDGIEILRFLGNIERLREGLQHVATLTLEGLEQFQETPALLTPSLSRRSSGADILKIIAQATAEKRAPISLGLFAINGWCDWVYIVDLDQNTFEVSGDLHKSSTRFIDVGGDHVNIPAPIKSFSFSQLPATEMRFLYTLEPGAEEAYNRLLSGLFGLCIGFCLLHTFPRGRAMLTHLRTYIFHIYIYGSTSLHNYH